MDYYFKLANKLRFTNEDKKYVFTTWLKCSKLNDFVYAMYYIFERPEVREYLKEDAIMYFFADKLSDCIDEYGIDYVCSCLPFNVLCKDYHQRFANYFFYHALPIDHTLESGKTLLIYAANAGYTLLVALLLKRGANPNTTMSDGTTALHEAAKEGHLAIIDLLLDHGADIDAIGIDGFTPLLIALQFRKFIIAEKLIKRNCDVNICNKDNRTALHYAAEYKRRDLTLLLLEKGANPRVALNHRSSFTPLHFAVWNNDYRLVSILLKANPSCLLDCCSVSTIKILNQAKLQQREENLNQLLEKHHDNAIPRRISNLTSLHLATIFNYEFLVIYLLTYGIDPALTANGMTALDFASALEFKNITALLIESSPLYRHLLTLVRMTKLGKLNLVDFLDDDSFTFPTPDDTQENLSPRTSLNTENEIDSSHHTQPRP